MGRELSIFVDESGDFGPNSRYYLLSFVFHNQSNKLEKPIQYMKNSIVLSNQKSNTAIHSYPLIRREGIYKNVNLLERKKLFNAIVAFMRYCKIKTKTIAVDKKHISNGTQLESIIEKELNNFLTEKYVQLFNFDKLIVYYDKGQKQITKILFNTFLNYFNNVDFRIVKPSDYFLFQVADLTCTLEMLDIKKNKLSTSERKFFGNKKILKKNYLKILYNKRID